MTDRALKVNKIPPGQPKTMERGYARGISQTSSAAISIVASKQKPNRLKSPKSTPRKGRQKSKAEAAPRRPSLLLQIRRERLQKIRELVYEHDEREVREFLIYILDKLPGVMLDLISYHREPLVAAISDDSTKGVDTSQVNVAMRKISLAATEHEKDSSEQLQPHEQQRRSFVDLLSTILKENQ
ncbi:uncharacterized protein LOC142341730 isoform X2 [Convolutriloba macropyga]|uniref:uncharacterized protein LOC142341730 isoform X2 n=1 Tax=Convolutriloba macropyga TaxID=536237 RepID=UPI003F52520F